MEEINRGIVSYQEFLAQSGNLRIFSNATLTLRPLPSADGRNVGNSLPKGGMSVSSPVYATVPMRVTNAIVQTVSPGKTAEMAGGYLGCVFYWRHRLNSSLLPILPFQFLKAGMIMKYKDLMKTEEYVDFCGLTEPEINSLRIFFSRWKASETPEDLMVSDDQVIKNTYPIEEVKELPIIQIDFESYIAYSITNESYTTWDDYEIFEGKFFRIYKKSRFLDFISTHTFATESFPGPFVHYGIVCLNHIINIVSSDEPIIREVKR